MALNADDRKRLEELEREVQRLKRGDRSYRPMLYYGGYEYKSEKQIFGLPLIHVVSRGGSDPENPKFVARGIIAIGDIAIGVLAIGGLAFGFFTLGGLALGLIFAFAGVAIGGISFGGLSIGGLAIGGGAIGVVAIGGFAAGYYAFGGAAVGKYVISESVRDPEAVEFLHNFFGNAADKLFRCWKRGC